MLNIYYKVWVDAIVFEQTKNGERRNWKIFTLIPISVFQGINLLTIFFWIRSFTRHFNPFIAINLFQIEAINAFLSFAITCYIPFLVLNYLLIFYNHRYESLIAKYKYRNGKLYLTYFLFSIGVFIIPIIVGKFIFK